MSRGPGRIERVIIAAMADDPDNAFTVEDVADRAYPDANRVEKKHRVAILRAMRSLADRHPHRFAHRHARGIGSTLIIYDPCHLPSASMAYAKGGGGPPYRRKGHWYGREHPQPADQERELRRLLAAGGAMHNAVGPNTWVDRSVRLAIARRDGHHVLAAAIEEQGERAFAAFVKAGQTLAAGRRR